MKKIFLTGTSGFIGQHLLKVLAPIHHVHQFTGDIRYREDIEQEMEAFKPDVVVHLAAQTEVQNSFYDQDGFARTNFIGTINMAESAVKHGVKKFVFASTMEVYGHHPFSDYLKNGGEFDPGHHVYDESTPLHPNSPYAVAKVACENYLEYLERTQGLQWVALRQTNCYGRHDNDFFVTERIITQMLNSNEVNLGYKDPYRNFIYIDDLLEAWIVIIESDKAHGIYTIGPNNAIRIEDYAHMIADKIDWRGKINWDTQPARPGEIWLLNSGHDKITADTDWKPQVDLSTGLDFTIAKWQK